MNTSKLCYILGGAGYYIIKEEIPIDYYDEYNNLSTELFSGTYNYLGYQIIVDTNIGSIILEVHYSIVNIPLGSEKTTLDPIFGILKFFMFFP
jgi:hypothetical protein